MAHSVWLKAIILWIAILVLAIANGILREKVLLPNLTPHAAFITSGALLSICIFTVAFFAAPWYGVLSPRQWWYVGLFWLSLTLAFEFGFGHFVQHKTWVELLQAYRFKEGNIWPIVLLVTALSPWLSAILRRLV